MTGDRLTTAAPLLMVGMLAALTFWLEQIAQPPVRSIGGSRDDPDYIVDHLSALALNRAGTANYTLAAEKMVHFPEGDTTLLTTPKIVSYGAAQAPLTITANEAVVSANGTPERSSTNSFGYWPMRSSTADTSFAAPKKNGPWMR